MKNYRDLLTEIRAAFDGDLSAPKNIALRRASDVISAQTDLIAELVAALEKFDKLSLVIESSVRNWDNPNHAAVLTIIKDGRAVLARARSKGGE